MKNNSKKDLRTSVEDKSRDTISQESRRVKDDGKSCTCIKKSKNANHSYDTLCKFCQARAGKKTPTNNLRKSTDESKKLVDSKKVEIMKDFTKKM
jgi:hypothetical protein